MNIGQVARRSGLPPKTIRYYESVGLLPAAARTANGYRQYAENDLQTLRFVQRARSLGFSVRDVADLVGLWRDRERASADVKSLAIKHIEEIDARLQQLQSMRATLAALVDQCHGDTRADCPILRDIAGE